MKFVVILPFFFISHFVFSQPKSVIQEADNEIARKHYKNASDLLIAYYERKNDPSVLAKIGFTSAMHGDSEESIGWFEKALSNGQTLSDENQIIYANELYEYGQYDKTKSLLYSYFC